MEFLAGKVINYYSSIGVASIKISDYLEVGNHIHVKGHTTDFEQTVDSIQINRNQVNRASKGDIAGVKITDYVRKHDLVYRVQS